MNVQYDLFSDAFMRDPARTTCAMRDEEPVYFDPRAGAFFVTRYDDVKAIARDPRFITGRIGYILEGVDGELLEKAKKIHHFYTGWMVFHEGADHTRFRRALARAFAPKLVEPWRETIQSEVDVRLGSIAHAGASDLMKDVIWPACQSVVAAMLGIVDADDLATVVQAADDAFAILQDLDMSRREQVLDQSYRGVVELEAVFERTISERRNTERRPDVMDVMLHPDAPDHQLSDAYIVATCGNILVGGMGTSSGALGSAVLNLLLHPDQQQVMFAEPENIKRGVEELLRWESTALGLVRVATESVELAGTVIPRDSLVFALPSSANRQLDKFPNGDELDVTREDNRHLTFGDGPHYCIGAPFARLMMQVMLPRIFAALSGLSLVGTVEYVGWQSRSPRDLFVTFDAQSLRSLV